MNAQTTEQNGARQESRKPRSTQIGVVASHARDKSIKVSVSYSTMHPKYGKHLRRCTTLHAHDEKNEAYTGDRVEVMSCRPLSKTKAWRLVRIIERAPREGVE